MNQDLIASLGKVFKDAGFELEKVTEKHTTSGDYCATLSEDWELSIFIKNKSKIAIEIYDQKYPPNQGRMEGGYTVMPWIYGDKFDLNIPNSLSDIRDLITDPVDYLGMNRDCAYGDHNSSYHKDKYAEKCYHN